uniref:Uncharacterized protein n=1 Tax=Mustela putorius furo TaxID=9669 RepID=M3XQ11_MUSPF
WGLLWVSVLGFLAHVQGQRDFDLADALDDPEPTKKPNSGCLGHPKPLYVHRRGHVSALGDKTCRIQPLGFPNRLAPISQGPEVSSDCKHRRPRNGPSGQSTGYFGNTDRDDGRYPPRPKPPAGGGGSYYPSNDGSGNTH